jgi:hypothetical protein
LYWPKATEPEEDEPSRVAPFGGIVEAEPFRRRTGKLVHYVENGEPPPRSHEIEELRHRRPRRSLFVGGALLAVVLAAGLTYVMIQSVNPVAMPPTDAADPAKIIPAATPAHTDDKVAAAPAPSGDSSDSISRVIEPAGPGDPLAKAGAAPASADHPATDVAAGGDDSGQIISPESSRALVVGPPMPPVSSKAASDDSAGKLPPGASLAVPPSAMPAAGGTVPKRGRSSEPVSEPVSDASGAAPALDNGAPAADDASAVPAGPARVPIPRPKPVVLPDKAGQQLAAPPAVAFSGDLY